MFPGMFGKGPKRASKVEEQRLIQRAKNIKENPSIVIPECKNNCFLCKFGRVKRWVKKLEGAKEDKKKLERYSKKGPKLTRAVAATMLLANEGKAKLLATTKTPKGSISYAKRGDAGAKYLAGIQHFNDPLLRLMAYHDYAKKGFYIYSWKGNLVCTGKVDAPPKGYIRERVSSSNYQFNEKKKGYSCVHIDKETTYFTLTWLSPGLTFRVCERCAHDGSNLFIHLSSGIASPNNEKLFQFKGNYLMGCKSDCDKCITLGNRTPVKDSTKKQYFSGSISDKALIEKIVSENRSALKKNSEVFAVGEMCYGKDANSFLNSLKYEEWEKDILKRALKLKGPVLLEQGTVNELLEMVWEKHASELLGVMLDDEATVEDLIKEGEKEHKIPRDIIRQARKKKTELDELSALPSFRELPRRGKFTHDLILHYKTGGPEEALNYIKEINPRDTRMKALAYGFLSAIGRSESHRWKYDDNEVETGEFLSSYFEGLFESSGNDYAHKLQELLKMSGSTETIVLKDGTELR